MLIGDNCIDFFAVDGLNFGRVVLDFLRKIPVVNVPFGTAHVQEIGFRVIIDAGDSVLDGTVADNLELHISMADVEILGLALEHVVHLIPPDESLKKNEFVIAD